MKKCILVTGASGWLGTALVKALLARGDHVIGLDLHISGKINQLQEQYPNLTSIEVDLEDSAQVLAAFSRYQPNLVVHTAAIVGVALAEDVPMKAMQVNIGGTVNLLEAMRLNHVMRVINISTEETYGDFITPIIDENHAQKPISIYGLTKLAAENYGRVYANRYGLECINVRTCWVYGPDLPRPRVPKVFIDAALTGKPYHLEAGGDLAVDQVYIEDVITGVLLALDKTTHRYDAYHIATGHAPTIADVARIVCELVPGARISTSRGLYLHGNTFPTARKGALNITRARVELGYAPKYGLREGIERTLQETREILGRS